MKFGICNYSRGKFFRVQYLKVWYILLISSSLSWSIGIGTINNQKKYVPLLVLVANGRDG